MHADRGGSQHVHAALAGDGLRFGVEIVDHFHVIGDESDGHDDHVRRRGPTSRNTSAMSGSSHGWPGGPLRL